MAKGCCIGERPPVPERQLPSSDEYKRRGTFCIISVEQRHERSGRVVLLIDGESMGETRTDIRKGHFTYLIQGISDVEVKESSWIISPREDLGVVLEAKAISQKGMKNTASHRFAIRVRFDETGTIRLNEIWEIYKTKPITRRIQRLWQKRLTEGAMQYYTEILPGVLDSILFEPIASINGEQIEQIRKLQEQILSRAIQLAESQDALQISSTQLIKATREVLKQFNKH